MFVGLSSKVKTKGKNKKNVFEGFVTDKKTSFQAEKRKRKD